MDTSFSLKASIRDERNLDSLKNIPLLAEVAETNPVLLEKRISPFQNSSSKKAASSLFQSPIHSSAKEARDDKLAKKEKKEKRKKHKSKDEDNCEENGFQESKEERRARREKRRAEKRARKESDQKMGPESMEFDENSSYSNSGFSDVKRQKIMETSRPISEKPANLPAEANACTLTFDDNTKVVVQNIKKITLTSGDGAASFQSLKIGQKVVSIHPTKNALASCVVGWTPFLQKQSDSSSDGCMPFIISLKKLDLAEVESIKTKMVKK